ncbi:MAG: hypothetical protein MZV63_35945 [Marinilabiliales bacterium]|nr:hypothetical protein [Marinilabiliales bacterium]
MIFNEDGSLKQIIVYKDGKPADPKLAETGDKILDDLEKNKDKIKVTGYHRNSYQMMTQVVYNSGLLLASCCRTAPDAGAVSSGRNLPLVSTVSVFTDKGAITESDFAPEQILFPGSDRQEGEMRYCPSPMRPTCRSSRQYISAVDTTRTEIHNAHQNG